MHFHDFYEHFFPSPAIRSLDFRIDGGHGFIYFRSSPAGMSVTQRETDSEVRERHTFMEFTTHTHIMQALKRFCSEQQLLAAGGKFGDFFFPSSSFSPSCGIICMILLERWLQGQANQSRPPPPTFVTLG